MSSSSRRERNQPGGGGGDGGGRASGENQFVVTVPAFTHCHTINQTATLSVRHRRVSLMFYVLHPPLARRPAACAVDLTGASFPCQFSQSAPVTDRSASASRGLAEASRWHNKAEAARRALARSGSADVFLRLPPSFSPSPPPSSLVPPTPLPSASHTVKPRMFFTGDVRINRDRQLLLLLLRWCRTLEMLGCGITWNQYKTPH